MTKSARRLIQDLGPFPDQLSQAEQEVKQSKRKLSYALDHLGDKIVHTSQQLMKKKEQATLPLQKMKKLARQAKERQKVLRGQVTNAKSYVQANPRTSGGFIVLGFTSLIVGWFVGRRSHHPHRGSALDSVDLDRLTRDDPKSSIDFL